MLENAFRQFFLDGLNFLFAVNGVGLSGTDLLVKRFSLGGRFLASCSVGPGRAKDAFDEF